MSVIRGSNDTSDGVIDSCINTRGTLGDGRNIPFTVHPTGETCLGIYAPDVDEITFEIIRTICKVFFSKFSLYSVY